MLVFGFVVVFGGFGWLVLFGLLFYLWFGFECLSVWLVRFGWVWFLGLWFVVVWFLLVDMGVTNQ